MKRVSLALALILAAGSAMAARERTPPGSFLRYRATSAAELSAQIARDTAARVRYAQHFGVSPDEVGSYFEKNLKLITLSQPLKSTTWYVGRDGRSYKKTKLYPKGTLVFADQDGKPLLSWSCGNPLSASLPRKLKEAPTKVLAAPVETVTAAAVTSPPAPQIVETVPVAAAPPIGPLAMPEVAVPPPSTSKWFLPLFWWPSHRHRTVIPEPSALVVMAMGLAAAPVALKIRRR